MRPQSDLPRVFSVSPPASPTPSLAFLRRHSLSLLLGFVPIALALRVVRPEEHVTLFVASGLAILPLAAFIGRATEELSEQLGGSIGGLLNATFGNAAELIIGALALR